MRRIAIVGSRSLEPSGHVANVVLNELMELSANDEIDVLLRRPRSKPINPFERLVAELATTLGCEVTWFTPRLGGRVATFGRDIDLVSRADEVVAYFPDGEEMTGGTGHVVEKAMDQECPVRAYVVAGGTVRWVGGNERDTPT